MLLSRKRSAKFRDLCTVNTVLSALIQKTHFDAIHNRDSPELNLVKAFYVATRVITNIYFYLQKFAVSL